MIESYSSVEKPTESDFYTDVKYKIEYADELCRTYGDKAALARVTVRAIRRLRDSLIFKRRAKES